MKLNEGGGAEAPTVKVRRVVRVTPPPVAEIVIGVEVVRAVPEAVKVSVVEQLGVQVVGKKVPVTPVGSPVTENVVTCAVP